MTSTSRPSSPTPSSHSSSSSSFDPLTSFSESIVPIRPPTAPDTEVLIVVPGLGKDVRLAVDAGPGCGGIAWPAGEVLSNYLSYRHSLHPEHLRQKTIVELGSGTGLVGLVVGMLEPTARVWITDQAPLLPLMRQNIPLNFPSDPNPPVKVSELDWGNTQLNLNPDPNANDEDDLPSEPDIILAADCVYFEPAFPLLVETLCALAPVGAKREVLFCWKKRRKADMRFFKMLHKHFASALVDDDRPGERERYERQGVRLMRLVRTK